MAELTSFTPEGPMGILVGGGPAPGINGVISGAAIEALDRDCEVIGFYDGFESLCREQPIDLESETGPARKLDYPDLTHIHWEGGSILRTSRKCPTDDEIGMAVNNLNQLGIKYFLTIGGDDTLTTSRRIMLAKDNEALVAHVPKTIDNDVPLQEGVPTFGFETARAKGTETVTSLLYDAKTTRRWFFVVSMGRAAGYLALGIAKSAGATCAIIPEEFNAFYTEEGRPKTYLTLSDLADTVISSMLVRYTQTARPVPRQDGVAVIAEGVAELLSDDELSELERRGLAKLEWDDARNRDLKQIQLGRAIRLEVERKLKEEFTFEEGRGLTTGFVVKDLGYELRCCHPVPFDVEYTRDLGYAAAKRLFSGNTGELISLVNGRCEPIAYDKLPVDEENKIITRYVQVDSESYEVARRYMFRLTQDDLDGSERTESLMKAAGDKTIGAFRARFGRVIEIQAYPPK